MDILPDETTNPKPEIPVEYRKDPNRPTVLAGTDGTIWQQVDPKPNPNGYMRVIIGKRRTGSRKERIFVHTLMMRTFVGPKPAGMLCRHLNDNPADNRLSNLAWGTWQDNYDDRFRNGIANQGDGIHSAKLHDSQIHEILRLSIAGISQREIGIRFGVAQMTISDIINGRTWQHIERPPGFHRQPITEKNIAQGRRLKAARIAAKLSQAKLAERAGYSAGTVVRIERGHVAGGEKFWSKVCPIVGLDQTAIFWESPSFEVH